MPEIRKVTAVPLAQGARVLVMTVPECGANSARLNGKREALNEAIKSDEREGV